MTAIEKARKAIESQYKGKCTIIEYQSIQNQQTKRNDHKEVTVETDKPCHLSYKSIKNADSSNTASEITQIIELFIAPEIILKPGSKIIITQQGKTATYEQSGEPAVYSTHQQIVLVLKDKA